MLGLLGFLVVGIVLFSFGVLSQQNRLVMQEIWRLQRLVQRDAAEDDNGERR